MKTLNLVYPDKSDIKYKIDRFPDGQQQVNILDIGLGGNFYDLLDIPHDEQHEKVQIRSRLNNFQDLELIVCATKSLKRLNNRLKIHLYTPYFLGSRSDRQFEEGSNNYLKDVICPIINSLEFESVTVLDPHSDVLEACLNNFKKISNLELVKFTIRQLCGFTHSRNPKVDEFILVSPDAGASKKIYKLAEQIGYKGDIITCSKDRDVDGKLIKTVVPITGEQHNMLHKGPYKDFIIIDDICDGGATFINITKEIKAYFHESGKTKSKIYLIVTHGIFSKGFEELSKYFDGIYCTNSYSNMDFYPTNPEWNLKLVKQLNVF